MGRSFERILWRVAVAVTTIAPCVHAGSETAPASRPAADRFDSLEELQARFDQQAQDAVHAVEGHRLNALEAFVSSARESARRDAMLALIRTASAVRKWDRVMSAANQFVEDYPKDEELWSVRRMRLSAMIQAGRLDESRKEWERLSDPVDMGAWQQVYEAGMSVGEGLIDAGKVDEVKALYALIRKRFNFVTNIDEVLGPKTEELFWLGRTPPALEGKDLAGQPVDLTKDYKGKVVILDFWATWCGPCIAALPELKAVYRKYHPKGLEVIGISLDQRMEDLKSFVAREKIAWRQWCDLKSFAGPNPRKYDVSGIPTVFIINRQGKISRVGVPEGQLGAVIERLLGEAAPQ